MQTQSQTIVSLIVNDILKKFNEELKVKELVSHISQFNQHYVTKIAGAGTLTAYMPHPSLRKNFTHNQMNEDHYPPNIPIDDLANFTVKSMAESTDGTIIRPKQIQPNSKQTSRYRKTGSTFRGTSMTMRKKLSKDQLNKYFVIPPNTNNQAMELTAPSPSQQEIDLEFQLRAMQKKLYFTRQAQKQEQQQLQKVALALKRKRSPERPRGDFTYDLNGNFLHRKNHRRSFDVEQMKVSQSFDLKPKQKKSLHEFLQDAVENQERNQLNSRYHKSSIFNNSNKRQVSHLPFIKMCDNAKIKQENKNSEGHRTQRVSLKQFAESMEEKSFRHFSQIEKQRKDHELVAKLQSQRLQNLQLSMLGKNPEEPTDDGYNNLIKRRQSYIMTKYLKKLKDQNLEQQRKSLNFNGVSFPKTTAIHNYYRHDFNGERKMYETEVLSRVLDNTNSTK